jgi:hypothetical protein
MAEGFADEREIPDSTNPHPEVPVWWPLVTGLRCRSMTVCGRLTYHPCSNGGLSQPLWRRLTIHFYRGLGRCLKATIGEPKDRDSGRTGLWCRQPADLSGKRRVVMENFRKFSHAESFRKLSGKFPKWKLWSTKFSYTGNALRRW